MFAELKAVKEALRVLHSSSAEQLNVFELLHVASATGIVSEELGEG
jgi:hypothetical protein